MKKETNRRCKLAREVKIGNIAKKIADHKETIISYSPTPKYGAKKERAKIIITGPRDMLKEFVDSIWEGMN